MATPDRSRVAARMRRTIGTNGTPRVMRAAVPSSGMTRTAALLAIAATAFAAPAMAQTPAAGTGTGSGDAGAGATAQPRVPATVNARSPFLVDRASSEPLGLFPNQTSDPFVYPDEPVVLSWSPVPGAVQYVVEIATTPGFTQIIWKDTTDQIQAAPGVLLPDGTYWWRVTAIDVAGTKGVASRVATFAKEWPSQVSNGVLSASPGGPATSLVRITPFMRWDPVPGAAFYETQVAAADQFASPIFRSQNFPVTGMNPGLSGVLPDDSYQWRVRALDVAKNPGPWVDMGGFTKAWVKPTLIGPADGATTYNFHLAWEPVAGAESYQVQVTRQQNVWQGNPLEINATTASTGFVPTLKEQADKGMGFGLHWWRVRPIVNGVLGSWTDPRRIDWQPASAGERTPAAQLTTATDSSSALTPHMTWTPVDGANMYRIDVATDANFNNIVEQASTKSTTWATRLPLVDNQVREGYFWRVIWGTGASDDDPQWQVAEHLAPVSQFRKQTRVTLGTAASGVVSKPPLFTWSDVYGAARYELQLSRDEEFDGARTQSVQVWGLGTDWTKDSAKQLASGTWYWRVRALDAAGNGQTWSPVGRFTFNPPRPSTSGPNDGATVVGSPLLQWRPVDGSCGYQVQVAENPSFQGAGSGAGDGVGTGGDGAVTPGAPSGNPSEAEDALITPQSGLIPSGAVVTKPGLWYWRVRTILCADKDFSPWSVTSSFRSVRPPQFNLNAVPNKADFGRRVTVAGRLVHNGRGVTKPVLVLERRLWPSQDFSAYGTVRGDAAGRFAFSLSIKRTATWRLRWARTDKNPEGVAPFVIRATPRVSLALGRGRVVRKSTVRVAGSIYPKRTALLQVRSSDGWRTIRRIKGKTRFKIAVRANLQPGVQTLRLFVPQDARRTLEPTGSKQRRLFVYDKFVVRGRR